MRSTISIILTLHLVYFSLVSGQTATIEIVDGTAPVTDGETQAEKQVVVTCKVNGHGIAHQTEIVYSDDDGHNWDPVYSGTAQGRWADTAVYGTNVQLIDGDTTEQITLTIKAVTTDDEGKYRCRVKGKANGNEIDGKEVEIKVYAQTDEVSLDGVVDGKYKVVAEESKSVVCRAINGSMPMMSLKVGTESVLPDMTVVQDGEDESSYMARGTYKFTSDQDGKQVTCSALVKTFTEAVASSATLQITAKPVVTCSPMKIAMALKSKAVYTCTVDAKPLPRADQIYWAAETNGYTLSGTEDKPDSGLKSESKLVDGKLEVVFTVTVMEINSPDKFTITARNDEGASNGVKVELTLPGTTDVSDGNKDNGSTSLTAAYAFTLILVIAALRFLL